MNYASCRAAARQARGPRGRAKSYPPELRDLAIQRVVEQGWTIAAAARTADVPQDMVGGWVRSHREDMGLSHRWIARPAFSEQDREFATRLVLDEGKTAVFAAKAVGASPAAVCNWVRKARIARMSGNGQSRPLGEAVRMALGEALTRRDIARVLAQRQVEALE